MSHKTVLLAHRGFSGYYPENSPIAFQAAIEQTACDGFESDVHITKDGKLVIFHDATLERTSNGIGYLKDCTYEELLRLDIGAWKDASFAGQHIWTLDELLDLCKQTHKVLNLELKDYEVFYDTLGERVIAAICAHKMQDRVFVSSFNHISMQHFKSCNGDIKTGLLYDKPLLDMQAYIARSNADNMHPRYMLLQYQPELVELYHAHAMNVNTWTVNDEENMRDMLARGVDCIISNFPDLLCSTYESVCG